MEKIRCRASKRLGKEPDLLNFPFYSSLGGFGKVLKGHFVMQEEEEPGGGG